MSDLLWPLFEPIYRIQTLEEMLAPLGQLEPEVKDLLDSVIGIAKSLAENFSANDNI